MGSLITDKDLSRNPTSKDIWLTDPAPKGQGRFCARITPAGRKLFYYRFTNSQGRREFALIGSYNAKGNGGYTLEQARKKAHELRQLYVGGATDLKAHISQAEETAQAQLKVQQIEAELEAERLKQQALDDAAARAARVTVAVLFEEWTLIGLVKRKAGSKQELIRNFKTNVLPYIGCKPVTDVTCADVMAVLNRIKAREAMRLANRTFSEMKQFFRYAYVNGKTAEDCTRNIKQGDVGGKEEARDRVLSEDEIRQLPEKIKAARLTPELEAILWIMLSTGCRIGDIARARWSEVDFNKATWTFRPEKDRLNKDRRHIVYLSKFSLDWFQRIRRIDPNQDLIFPDATGTKPVNKRSYTQQIGARQQLTTEGQKSPDLAQTLLLSGIRWTPHDLRRTCATLMVDLGVLSEVADKILYHVEPNQIKRTYNRAKQTEAQAEAWRILGERLEILTGGDDMANVVPLHKSMER